MKKLILIFIGIYFINITIAQNQKPTFVTNSNLSFENFIAGVKYAEIGLNMLNQENVDKHTGIGGFYFLAQKYLYDIGFEYVALTSEEKTELDISLNSYCDYAQVIFGGEINDKSISNMTITFISCNGDVYSFTSNNKFTYRKLKDVEKKLVDDWKSIVSSKLNYKAAKRLKLPTNPTGWSKEKILNYLNSNKTKLDPIEGIYERVRLSFEDISGGKYTVGIIKNPDEEGYLVVYLSGAKNNLDWAASEIKGIFEKTATSGLYSVHWIMRDKSLYEDVYCTVDATGFNIFSTGIIDISYKFIKMLPVSEK